MTPYVGQIVIHHNSIPKGCCVPSVVTRVWSDTCVNLSMLSGPFLGCERISVPLNEGPSTDDFSWSYTDVDRDTAKQPKTEESKRLHREYNDLVAAQLAGAKNGAEVRRLTDECAAKGIILVPGGELD